MYVVDLVRRNAETGEPERVIVTEPNIDDLDQAIAAGHRVFSSRAAEQGATGFRVAKLGSGEVVHLWYEADDA